MFDLYGDRRLLTRKDRPKGNGQSSDGEHERKGPVDVDARLDAAEWHGPGDTAFNIVARDTMASQLRCGVCLTEAANVVFAKTAAGARC